MVLKIYRKITKAYSEMDALFFCPDLSEKDILTEKKEKRIMKHEKLDTVDRIILDILQENAKTPLKEIANKVYLSTPAVSARIEKMEREGVITGYHAQIDPPALGYHIKALINLEVPPEDKKDFYPFVKERGNVIECNCVTGDVCRTGEHFP